jgi:hypothetical protein
MIIQSTPGHTAIDSQCSRDDAMSSFGWNDLLAFVAD